MSNLIQYTNLDTIEQSGKKLYKNNKYFHTLTNLMEHPEFRGFFDEHFKDWDSIRTTMMFMKTYEMIEKMAPKELNGYQKLAILYNCFNSGDIRQEIVKSMNKFENGEMRTIDIKNK